MGFIKNKYRSQSCGDIGVVGEKVILSGWVHRKRDHGGVIFIDLRDNFGMMQIVFPKELTPQIEKVRVESVIRVEGEIKARTKEQVNEKVPTGTIEVFVSSFEILSSSQVLPFQISEEDGAPEATRLEYRFLELRREELHKHILLRSSVIKEIRAVMHELGFTEFQTPILTSSSPEGARDFLVPSRHHKGKFFALPQAPQQFKQLLMISGFDRYFQIAPCFRDEDPRADRSPGEFYQCDLEMSFVEQEDVFKTCEQLFFRVFSKFAQHPVTNTPFPRFTYAEAMNLFGTDKPDLRVPETIRKVSEVFTNSTFKVFQNALAQSGDIYAIAYSVDKTPPRKYFDDLIEWYQKLTGNGVAYLIRENGETRGNISKFVSEEEVKSLALPESSVAFFAAGTNVLQGFGKLRVKVSEDLGTIKRDQFCFCWITDYPMYELVDGKIDFSHNPFSMPQGGLEALNSKDPLEIKAYQYDVVCNGYELSSGAIRNHDPEIMYRAFEIVGYSKEEVESQFGGIIKAFKFGAPPHGGMAPGVDRMVMLLAGKEAVRDVIAFPLAQSVEDLMMNAPSEVSERHLKELGLKIV